MGGTSDLHREIQKQYTLQLRAMLLIKMKTEKTVNIKI